LLEYFCWNIFSYIIHKNIEDLLHACCITYFLFYYTLLFKLLVKICIISV
jgi:hypothetical protein